MGFYRVVRSRDCEEGAGTEITPGRYGLNAPSREHPYTKPRTAADDRSSTRRTIVRSASTCFAGIATARLARTWNPSL